MTIDPPPRIASIATAVPSHLLDQGHVKQRAALAFGDAFERLDKMLGAFDNAGIDSRYACAPVEWLEKEHGNEEKNILYLENATALLAKAASESLEAAGLEPEDIDTIVVVSTTGIATPSLDALLMEVLPFRRDVQRLPIFGLGCVGGVVGLARAAAMARVRPGSRVLFLVVELCTLTFRRNDYSKSNLIASALFGDGAAAAVLSPEGTGPAVSAWGEHTWPKSLDIMGWDVADDGLKVLFSRDIPSLVRRHMRKATDDFLGLHGLDLADIDAFVCHPGGAKVLTALERSFDLPDGGLEESRAVLGEYGNMSAATVMFVLQRALAAPAATEKGKRYLMTSMGPGFTAGFTLLESP